MTYDDNDDEDDDDDDADYDDKDDKQQCPQVPFACLGYRVVMLCVFSFCSSARVGCSLAFRVGGAGVGGAGVMAALALESELDIGEVEPNNTRNLFHEHRNNNEPIL